MMAAFVKRFLAFLIAFSLIVGQGVAVSYAMPLADTITSKQVSRVTASSQEHDCCPNAEKSAPLPAKAKLNCAMHCYLSAQQIVLPATPEIVVCLLTRINFGVVHISGNGRIEPPESPPPIA